MSRKTDDETPSLTKEALELLRTRELYKYFEPLSAPSDDGEYKPKRRPPSPDSDEDDSQFIYGERPLSTGDPVLGSIVLLAERLLNADRVIVIFADAFREYLVADSGQALSHFTRVESFTEGAPHPGSWKKRCRNRDDLFSVFLQGPASNELRTVADGELPTNDKWRREWPHIRRYAGVPIKTRTGSVIGALCALYKKPTGDDSKAEGDYNGMFQKLTAAVLRYMEVVRGEREMKRGRRMEVALSRFIAGNFSPDKVALTAQPQGAMRVETSNQESERIDGERAEITKARGQKELERWRGREAKRRAAGIQDDESSRAASVPPVSTAQTPIQASTQASSVVRGSYEVASEVASVSDTPPYFDSRPSPRDRRSQSPSPPNFAGHYGQPFKYPDRSPPLPSSKRKKSRRDPSPWSGFNASYLSREPHMPYFLPDPEDARPEPPLSQRKCNVAGSEVASVRSLPVSVAAAQHALCMRASDIMRRAMNVDGIVFVNYDLEGLSDLDLPAPPPGPISPLNHTSSDQRHSKVVRAERAQDLRTRSGVLGVSAVRVGTAKSSDHASIVEAVGVDVSELSELYLHTLCESWPRGCIFAYSRDPKHPVLGITVNPDDSDESDGPLHEETDNHEIVDVLRRFLPGSKSVMFIPLYDFVGKVFAVGFAWRSSPVRVFRGDVEGGFMAAFCDSIMQEISRIQVVSANVAKGNFISTISHELRSPLHGILASCELFCESALSDYERDLMGSITYCGRTLLDTVNNVLTFTELNTKANTRKDQKKQGSVGRLDQDLGAGRLTPVSEVPVMDIDLGKLVEEVVETSYIGYRFDPNPKQEHYSHPAGSGSEVGELPTEEHVHVTLAIDPEISQRRFKVPPGAIRRLVLNLCTNALKYTDKGWVQVRLTLHDVKADQNNVTLTVADSGRGISREFLKDCLFMPFMQEFPMHSGLGLGMSIVRQLVDELGGTVDVQSQVGAGTEVIVSLKLESTLPGADAQGQYSDDIIWKAKEVLPGKSASLVGLDYDSRPTATREAFRGLQSYLRSLLTETFGMTVQDSTLKSVTTDCAIVQGGKELTKYLEDIANSQQTSPPVPLIELGGGRVGSTATAAAHQQDKWQRNLVVYLSRPYCPRKVAAALLWAIQGTPPKPDQRGLPPPSQPLYNQSKPRPLSQGSSSPRDNQLTVLIVEDNFINMKLLATFFKKSGYSFEQAVNGLEALQAVQQRPEGFDVILMDLQMPVMSGIDSTRAIRELEVERGTQKCCIIALTALSGDEAKLESYRAGVDMFLVKPVKMSELRAILVGKKR